jgi:hypothetical protein
LWALRDVDHLANLSWVIRELVFVTSLIDANTERRVAAAVRKRSMSDLRGKGARSS